MLKHKKYRIVALAFLFLGIISAASLSMYAQAEAQLPDNGGSTTTTTTPPGTLNINAGVARVNRMTLQMGDTFFYDSNTTDNDWTFKSIGLTCSASIKYVQGSGGPHGSATPTTYTLTYTSPLSSGSGCGPENTKTLTQPLNWSERQYVVFAGGSSDGQFISVKPDNGAVFKKGGTYNGDTVYIQQGVDPYSCPLVIVTNSRSTALIPLEKKDKEADVSNQIKTLFDRELGVGDTACGPTDNDKLGIFSQFGLPESYYNAGHTKDHYETTDFGFDGQNVGSATIYVASIAQAAGIALNGPLKGGGYDGSSDSTATGSAGDASPTTCAVDGIGWIICPVMGFVAKVNDSAFAFLKSFLGIRPSLINSDGAQNAWKAFRDIANVAFVIAFLVIVYSQLTSAGISNYGIKKMLPRIVIAAILVNLSYFICAIMVDLSNILGASIYSLLKGFDVGTSVSDPSWQSAVSGTNGILAKAASGIAVVLLAIAVFLAPTTLLAFAVIILILIARQAFVVLLLVISPLAFVAYLLPNTEDWFKRWWKALVATLMVYPIIGAVFGASTLAANILSSVKDSTSDDPSLMQLIALGVLAVPLFAVPALLKGSLAAAGSVGARLQGMADKAQGRAASRGKERFKESAAGQFLSYRSQTRQRNRALSRSGLKSGSNRNPLNWGRNANAAVMSRVNSSSASGAFGDRLAAGGAELEDKMWDEEVKRQKTLITVGKNLSNEQILTELASGKGSAEYQAALGSVIMQRDHRESHLRALEITRQRNAAAAEGSKEAATVMGIQKQMAHDGGSNMPWAMGDQALGDMVEGKFGAAGHKGNTETLQEQMKERVGKKLSVKTLATMNPDELKSIHKMARDGQLSPSELANLQAKINDLRTDPQYKGMEKPEASVLFNELVSNAYAPDPATGSGSAHYNDSRVF